MSQENVELVRRGFEHFQSGRFDAWVETLDPELEWDISAHPLPDFPNTGSGRDAFLGHMAVYVSGWNDYEVSMGELIGRDDEVVAIQHERARMRGSEMTLDRDLPLVLTVHDGCVVRFRVFKTREQALDAAGLSE